MLDIRFIRENTETVKKGMLAKGEPSSEPVDRVLEADRNWRDGLQELEQLRNESKTKAKKIGQLKSQGKDDEAQAIIDETSRMKKRIKELEDSVDTHKQERDNLLLNIPNVPHSSVPVGEDESANEVFATWGECDTEGDKKPHWELTADRNWIDFERGAKVTGAGFPFYLGGLARFQRALINFFLAEAAQKGYTEMIPPYVVNEASARGTGQLPDKEDMMYEIQRDELYAIPTAEVPVTNYYRDEILSEEELPCKFAAFTPCWRREAGSYGAEVRGLNRLHQFDKVELVKLVHPDQSYDELESLRTDAEDLLKKLELPYRTLLMCTGDMGFTQTKKYDLEVWSAGQQRWLEVSSCSNFEAYQARRMQLRYKDANGDNQLVHTLNGSGLAVPRVVAAVLENYQTPEGDVKIPEVLQPFYGGELLQ